MHEIEDLTLKFYRRLTPIQRQSFAELIEKLSAALPREKPTDGANAQAQIQSHGTAAERNVP